MYLVGGKCNFKKGWKSHYTRYTLRRVNLAQLPHSEEFLTFLVLLFHPGFSGFQGLDPDQWHADDTGIFFQNSQTLLTKWRSYFLASLRFFRPFGGKRQSRAASGNRYVLSFGANERTKENIHPWPNLSPIWDRLNCKSQKPLIYSFLVWLSSLCPCGVSHGFYRLAHWVVHRANIWNAFSVRSHPFPSRGGAGGEV